MTPRLEIEYYAQCRWLLRAAWMAQELLTTFENGIGEVAGIDPPSDFHAAPGADSIFCVRRPAAERISLLKAILSQIKS
jgi:predicted Rdx family selenoprotein